MKCKMLIYAVVVGALTLGDAKSGGQKKSAGPDKVGQPGLPAVLKGKPKTANPNDDELRRLMIARYNVALLEAQKRLGKMRVAFSFSEHFTVGATDQCVKRLFESELALAEDSDARVKACANYLEVARALEEIGKAEIEFAGESSPGAFEACQYLRADAEVLFCLSRIWKNASFGLV